MIRVGSLFSGIGGLDLGLVRSGMEIVWQVEIDPFCQMILIKHWPEVKCYGDVRTVSGTELEAVDLVAGGFPCQPVSIAGRHEGTKDERWLWPEFARIVGVLRPKYVLVENVPNLFNINQGEAFKEILTDLAEMGYDAEWFCLRASDVGAPHRRERIFIVAYPSGVEREPRPKIAPVLLRVFEEREECNNLGGPSEERNWPTPHANCHTGAGHRGRDGGLNLQTAVKMWPTPAFKDWKSGKASSETMAQGGRPLNEVIGYGSNGSLNPDWVETLMGFPAGWTDPERPPVWNDNPGWPAGRGELQYAWEPPRLVNGRQPYRKQRLQALGNAVMPQVSELIGRAIMTVDKLERRIDDGTEAEV